MVGYAYVGKLTKKDIRIERLPVGVTTPTAPPSGTATTTTVGEVTTTTAPEGPGEEATTTTTEFSSGPL
jgi:hypothetical protein